MKFVLDGVTKFDNASPFTWAGDQHKLGGGTDFLGFTSSPGLHKLEATPYTGINGAGAQGPTHQRLVLNK